MITIATLLAQIIAITTQVWSLAIAAGNNAPATTTASIFAMKPVQVKADNVIDYSDEVGLSQ